MKLKAQRLDWDSKFFGFGVGQLEGPVDSAALLSRALQDAALQGLKLVYGRCGRTDVTSQHLCLEFGGRFVDSKRTYALSLEDEPPLMSTSPTLLTDVDPCSRRQLRTLAWESAKFSRYRADPDMPYGSWRRMYSTWIANSLNGTLADSIFVEREPPHEGGRVVGMVTVSHRAKHGAIGLLGVDARWRGCGLGQRLISAAASRCRDAKCTRIEVVTQRANSPACLAYERAGYELANEQHVFHFWIQQP